MSQETGPVVDDKFVDLMRATAEVDLRLERFSSSPALKTAAHTDRAAAFPSHRLSQPLGLDGPEDVLAVMDQCGVERVVNITMQVGQAALDIIDRYRDLPDRFSSIGWMDWSGVERTDFVQVTMDRIHRLDGAWRLRDQVLEGFRPHTARRRRQTAAH